MSDEKELQAFERFRASYEEARSQGETGDASLDMLLITSGPGFATLLRSLAVPHWFDERIVELLTPAELAEPTSRVLETVTGLSFVRAHRRGLALHDKARERLRAATITRHEPLFRAASASLEGYFAAWAGREPDETLRWERIYHLIGVDEDRGLDAFGEEFRRARLERQYHACHTLADMLAEQQPILSQTGVAWADYYRGIVLFDTQQWDTARQTFVGIDVDALPKTLTGRIALYRGMTAEAHEDWPEAIRIYNQALGRLALDYGLELPARIHQHLADAYFSMRDLPAAEREALASLDLNQRQGDAFGQALNNRTIGRIYAEIGDVKKASLSYEQALAALDQAGRAFAKSTIYRDLAKLQLGQNNLAESEHFYQEAIRLRTQGGDNYGLAILYLDLGNLKIRRSDFDGALRYIDRSQEIFQRFNDHRNLAKLLNNKSVALEQAGDTSGAIAALREAIALLSAADLPTDRYEKALHRLEFGDRKAKKITGCLVVALILVALMVVLGGLEAIFVK